MVPQSPSPLRQSNDDLPPIQVQGVTPRAYRGTTLSRSSDEVDLGSDRRGRSQQRWSTFLSGRRGVSESTETWHRTLPFPNNLGPPLLLTPNSESEQTVVGCSPETPTGMSDRAHPAPTPKNKPQTDLISLRTDSSKDRTTRWRKDQETGLSRRKQRRKTHKTKTVTDDYKDRRSRDTTLLLRFPFTSQRRVQDSGGPNSRKRCRESEKYTQNTYYRS